MNLLDLLICLLFSLVLHGSIRIYVHLVVAVPEEFHYDPVTKSYGEPTRRPEAKNGTIEFIAPSEYMVSIFPLLLHYQLTSIRFSLNRNCKYFSFF